MGFWKTVITCIVGTTLLGCAAAHEDRQPGEHGVPLECPPDVPADTLGPLERCVLEYYRPCQLDVVNPVPASYLLEFEEGRLVRESDDIGGLQATYVYDGGVLVSRTADLAGTTVYEYEEGRLVRVRPSSDPESSYRYEGDFRDGGSATITRETDDGLSSWSVTHEFEGGVLVESVFSGDFVDRHTFAYEGGLLAERTEEVSFEVWTYEYDGDRLARAVQSSPFEYEIEYTYDDGNRLAHVSATGAEPLEITLIYDCD